MILALETAGSVTHLWLFADAGHIEDAYQMTWESGRELSDQLLGRINSFVQTHRRGLKDLSGIVIFRGPGSFTSLRIGHATANALADSLEIPVVGARGEQWLEQATQKLGTAKIGVPAVPHYGSEAHITKPKS
ncbi:MAG TPA: tRNA (adenosine(37)-N6)-threonylcarbamoyltransferase complex dimerization subunit type 1 TsaB [Candidatus Saccharimonadia bacterium]|nr:tRNA (adenosine(37)-N6)-threonylcarbamoyltransferase complex dimerization subunit type 1 TsaB [Candidatus Saccharimonadia bacterium]